MQLPSSITLLFTLLILGLTALAAPIPRTAEERSVFNLTGRVIDTPIPRALKQFRPKRRIHAHTPPVEVAARHNDEQNDNNNGYGNNNNNGDNRGHNYGGQGHTNTQGGHYGDDHGHGYGYDHGPKPPKPSSWPTPYGYGSGY
ncbi:hypothetical protein P691DRAFT_769532 [Macrolepiota fuliginosa MF-IS2]|uniref:Uncharacterized protein n=1 Tax=Macrolepiota fuliginosa MF-IS2 TaxID=1400762 RepID=A0A9P5WXD9_9AGAR|nr:hypothetical protein P691DRAFT_769532 [Macrolepiota fuliginosa MF-IS2]